MGHDAVAVLPIVAKLLEAQAALDKVRDVLLALTERTDDPDLLDMALDLLGVPPDNTVETNPCEIQAKTGAWPDGAYCRDWHYGEWEDCGRDPGKFIDSIMASIDEEQSRQAEAKGGRE